MSILNVEHLTHGFGDRAIFNDVSFRLLKGEHIGLVGANGEGKSTFLNIITGKLMPDEGKIEWAKNVRVGYLDQHTALAAGQSIRQVLSSAFDFLFALETQMNEICDKMGDADPDLLETYMEELGTIQELLNLHDFYMIDAKVEEVARALGLADIGLERDVTELSGGQRTKVLLGKLLLEKPDILLLDEPTNYLDAEHIEWLRRYLTEYENAFILISHDIPFLNSVINLIYHMDRQELNRYVGDYDKFQEVYAMKKAQLEAAYNRQQKEIADLKDFVARNKARVSTRNMAMSRQKKLDKMDVIELAAEKPRPEFCFREARTPGRILFETRDLVIGYEEPLSSPLNLSMERGQKIALIGANGIGKTTLLKSILGLIPSCRRFSCKKMSRLDCYDFITVHSPMKIMLCCPDCFLTRLLQEHLGSFRHGEVFPGHRVYAHHRGNRFLPGPGCGPSLRPFPPGEEAGGGLEEDRSHCGCGPSGLRPYLCPRHRAVFGHRPAGAAQRGGAGGAGHHSVAGWKVRLVFLSQESPL